MAAVAALAATAASTLAAVVAFFAVFTFKAVFTVKGFFTLVIKRAVDMTVLDRSDFVLLASIDFDQSAKIIIIVMIEYAVLAVISAVFAKLVVAGIILVTIVDGPQRGFFLRMRGFFSQQRFAVFLVIW